MKNTKPQPRPSPLLTREAAKPIVQPEARPLREDHPAAEIYRLAKEAADAQPTHATTDSRTIYGSPTTEDSSIVDSSPTIDRRAITQDSPIKKAAIALPYGSPTTSDSPTAREHPKRRTRAEYRTGDSRTNNDFFDAELCSLPPLSQLLWFHLNRYRERGSELTVVLSWKRLAERFGDAQMHINSMRRAFAPLERAGLAVKERAVFGKGGEQGIIFRLYTHSSPTTDSSPTTHSSNKRTALKENNKKGNIRLTPEEIKSFTATVVDLLAEGKSVEEVEGAYAPSMHPADWAAVKSVALAQGATKKGK